MICGLRFNLKTLNDVIQDNKKYRHNKLIFIYQVVSTFTNNSYLNTTHRNDEKLTLNKTI